MAVRLTFDGQKLTWPGIGIFKATTGLPDLQWPDKQCVPDAAIPEGNYKLFIQFQGEAPIRNAADCDLGPSWGWSTIPRGQAAGTCEIYWANWDITVSGWNQRMRRPEKPVGGKRGGFYIHDSTKGYSHGCIEVEPVFFPYSETGDGKKKMVKRHLRLMLSMFLVSKRMVEQNNNTVKTGSNYRV